MELISSAFNNYGRIPRRYTKEGDNMSPPLSWTSPKGCKQFAIVCEDPDAPKIAGQDHPFTHWLIFGISATTLSLPENLPYETVLKKSVRANQGVNSFGKAGYGGPMPPVDSGLHHYVFTLYALNTELNLDGGSDKQTLMQAMNDHVIATVTLTGTYERRSEQKIKHDAVLST